MLYDWIKVLHVISAALVFGLGILLTVVLWFARQSGDIEFFSQTLNRTLQLNNAVILPAGVFQLLSGFSMLSLKQYNLHLLWVQTVYIGFFLGIFCWIAMMYFLTKTRHALAENKVDKPPAFNHFMLTAWITIALIFVIIFMMAGKITHF